MQRLATAHTTDTAALVDSRRRPDTIVVRDVCGIYWSVPLERYAVNGRTLPGIWNRFDAATVDADPTPAHGVIVGRPFDWQLDDPEMAAA